MAQHVAHRSEPPKLSDRNRAPQLTRDHLVARGDFEVCRKVDKPLTVALLIAKLHSETEEIAKDLTNPEEYGDLLETLMSLAELNGITFDQITDAAYDKQRAKGGLTGGNFWIPEPFMEKN